MLNDTTRYLADLFYFDNPFEENVPNIYPPELQFHKSNAMNSKTPFRDLNILINDNNIHPYDISLC